jgi:transposase-like protein
MRQECSMAKRQQRRKRRSFTPEFKAEAVRLCRVGDRTIRQVASDLDLTETALREWVKRGDEVASAANAGAVTQDERDELRELRKRVKRLEMEREILKKATAFFAKENG